MTTSADFLRIATKKNQNDFFDALHKFARHVLAGRLHPALRKLWNGGRVVCPLKPSGKIRPILILAALLRAISKAVLIQETRKPGDDSILKKLGPSQYGCGVKSGGAQLTLALRILADDMMGTVPLAANAPPRPDMSDWGVVGVDVLMARVGPDQYEKELEPCQGFIRTLPPN